MNKVKENGFSVDFMSNIGNNDLFLTPVHDLECEAFPPDEAAKKESMKQRLTDASSYFYTLYKYKDDYNIPIILAYVCGTVIHGDSLTDESMSEHHPNGNLLCIHSVSVKENWRRKGIATQMLKDYVKIISKRNSSITKITLICKKQLICLYKGAGFEYIGKSSVIHGKDPWYEMSISLSQ